MRAAAAGSPVASEVCAQVEAAAVGGGSGWPGGVAVGCSGRQAAC